MGDFGAPPRPPAIRAARPRAVHRRAAARSPSPAGAPPPRAANPSKTFLGGLNYDTTEEGLRQYFESKYGHVADAHVVRERDTQRSRGFGFVTFSDPDVARAVQASDHVIDGRNVLAREATPKGGGGPPPRGPPGGGGGGGGDDLERGLLDDSELVADRAPPPKGVTAARWAVASDHRRDG